MANQPLHIPAGLGIDQGTRPEHVPLGQANLLNRNARNNERLGLEKRLAFHPLTTTRLSGSRSVGKRVLSHYGAICTVDGTYADLYVEGKDVWRSLGRVPEVMPRFIGAPSFFSATVEDIAYANGYFALVSLAENASGTEDTVVSIIDSNTEQPAYASTIIGSGTTQARVIAISNRYFIAVYQSGTNITAYYFDTNTFGGWTEIGGAGGGGVGARLGGNITVTSELAVEQLSDRGVIVYGNDGGGTTRLTVKAFDITGVLQSTTLTTAADEVSKVDVAGQSGDTVWVAWGTELATSVSLIGLSPSSISTVVSTVSTSAVTTTNGPGHISLILTTSGNGQITVQDGTTDTLHLNTFVNFLGNTAPGTQWHVYNCLPAARGFYRNGRTYLQVYSGDRNTSLSCAQQQIVLADITGSSTFVRPVCLHSFNTSTISTCRKTKTVVGGTNTLLYSALNRKKTASSVAAEIAEYDFLPVAWESAPYQGATFLTGGLLSYIDGDAVYEAGFLFRPPPPVFTITLGSGVTTSQGGFRYCYVYEHIDATGALTISGVSDISDLTGNHLASYDVKMAPLSITMRNNGRAQTRIGLYRTPDGGKVFYRLATVPFDGTASEITFTDFVSDTDLQSKPKLYRQSDFAGTAQDRRAPGPIKYITSYNGFLVGAFERVLYWSGQPVEGEGAWFSPIFQSNPLDDEITGIAPLDGALIVYTRRAIYITSGTPPTDNAAQGGMGDLRRISSDIGCISSRALVATSLGHFFRSDRGIELLTRGQTLEFVGLGIQTTLAEYPFVSSAVLDPKNGLVRFSCAATETSDSVGAVGVTLVFDLTIQKWISVDDVYGSSASVAAQSGAFVYYGGDWRYAFIEPGGTVYVEKDADDAAACVDGTSHWVELAWEPAIIRAGLQQQMRCANALLLLESRSAAGLKLQAAYNYEDYTDADAFRLKQWTDAELASLEHQLPFRPLDQTPAIRMRLTDVAPSGAYGNGKGFVYVGASFDVIPLGSADRGLPLLGDDLRK